ncbi:recombinase family protein [Erythrobacter sp.]|uniref:recombinase family protein n=1 Tax=Erythrobacter sp. TaxID=1042 RepID=UPI0014260056|nr:recombinase family protein [Erythrobacter sp.]QIQ87967.1 MAG: recombinase family protein [Erythrobacter sp.]
MPLAVGYLRVSTDRQPLGIEAQRRAVDAFAQQYGYDLIAGRYFEEVESGSRDDRPQLARALDVCRAYGATLIVARLDRLSRDAAFILTLRKEDIAIRFVDLPQADEFTVAILAVVAEHERRLISQRTKAALAVRKAQGAKLGGDRGGIPSDDARARSAASRRRRAAERARIALGQVDGWESMPPAAIADRLNGLGVPTASGRGWWTAEKARAAMRLFAK